MSGLLKSWLTCACLIVFFFWSSFCSADSTPSNDPSALEKLLNGIQQRVNNTKTVQCTFRQERNLSLFTRPILFTGKMSLSRPDKLRWENIDPIPSVMIFSGDTGIRCNDDAKPVYFELKKDPIMKMVGEQIWTWVDGNYTQLQSKYDITLTGEQEITLVPHSSEFSKTITSVTVQFTPESFQPETIHIREPEGDSTTIRFHNYRINQPINDLFFTNCYQ